MPSSYHPCLCTCQALPHPLLAPQAFAHVLSADGASDPDTLAVSAASTALLCSDMPWAGPVAAARAALLPGGELVVGPTVDQLEAASLNVVVAVTEGGRITMLEADGDQASAASGVAVGCVGHKAQCVSSAGCLALGDSSMCPKHAVGWLAAPPTGSPPLSQPAPAAAPPLCRCLKTSSCGRCGRQQRWRSSCWSRSASWLRRRGEVAVVDSWPLKADAVTILLHS